jgi:hypothetical protein
VYAGADVISFNADYAASDPTDIGAVYIDPDVPANQLSAVGKANRFLIPYSGFTYPDTTYYVIGQTGVQNSAAETLTFFFEADATTSRSDDFVLMRQVNGTPPKTVARNLLKTGTTAFFEYLTLVVSDTMPSRLVSLAGPMAHMAAVHGSRLDVGAGARVDSVRAVRVRFTASNGVTGVQEQRRVVDRIIRLPNAGMATESVCGDRPRLGTSIAATKVTMPDGTQAVRLNWAAAVDENSGEKDVLRYVVLRRVVGTPSWGDPYAIIPAGLPTYSHFDQNIGGFAAGTRLEYALSAQDCTPSSSTPVMSTPVVVP